MTNNLGAGSLLDEAKRLVCNERSEHHGDTSQSFQVIAEFWQVYLRATHNTADIKVSSEDVAQMMSLLKKVRRIFGDKSNAENFIDDIGYTGIAGMFSGVQAPTHVIPMPKPESWASQTAIKPRFTGAIGLGAVDKELSNESIR